MPNNKYNQYSPYECQCGRISTTKASASFHKLYCSIPGSKSTSMKQKFTETFQTDNLVFNNFLDVIEEILELGYIAIHFKSKSAMKRCRVACMKLLDSSKKDPVSGKRVYDAGMVVALRNEILKLMKGK